MEKLELPAAMPNLGKLVDFAVDFAGKRGFEGEALAEVRLAAEEAIVNVVHYAYPGTEGAVEVACRELEGGGMELVITDSGVPFDPTSLPAPDTTLPMEQRKIGGLGIFMVKKVMDEVKYARRDGRNVLTLVKRK